MKAPQSIRQQALAFTLTEQDWAGVQDHHNPDITPTIANGGLLPDHYSSKKLVVYQNKDA